VAAIDYFTRKSQIAIEYSYKIRNDASDTWVFWVHASSTTRFEQSYREIAFKARIPGYDDPKGDILVPVLRWLREKSNGPWLVILDNADDRAVFFDRPDNKSGNANPANSSCPFINFIPQESHGMVLVTSRDKTVADHLVGDFSTPIKVDAFKALQSLEVLRTKVPVHTSEEPEALKLVKELDYIPLAITQAGAYIRQGAPRMTLQKYLSMFCKNNASQTTLLNSGAPDLRRDSEVPDAVISTWEISFIQIREQFLPAANLLSLLSLFNRQGIPKILIKPESHDDGSQSNNDYDLHDPEVEFENAIVLLDAFSLVRAETNGDFFEIHRLVQVATRRWLESNGSIQKWKSDAIAKMADKMPNGEYENWKICAILLPHAKEIITYQAVNVESRLQRASVLENVGWYESAVGNFDIAVQMREESLNVRRQFLHEDDSLVLSSMANLASTYRNQGRWKKAEELEVHVIETTKRILGQEHPDTLTSMANLASTYRNQGRWKEAEELEVHVIETIKRILGQEHPSTLRSMANLASTYRNQGRWKKAEELEVQVMKTTKRILGQEHPSTLTSMASLASTYRNQGRWKEAEELDVQVMKTTKRILGQEHPDTLTSMADLASTYWNQGRWKEAEELDVQVMKTRKRILGQEHPSTLRSMANLASTYWNQGRWKEAEELDVQVTETTKRILGQEHPDTLRGMANLASTYRKQGRWKDAEELDVHVIETRKRILGQEHPDTLMSMANLAYTLKSQDRDKEAIDLIKQVKRLQRDTLGSKHYLTMNSKRTLSEWQQESNSLC
jgi:tetratricopeptide (TPR) repeat protein